MKIILRLVVLVLENVYVFFWTAIEFLIYELLFGPYFPQMIDAPPKLFENQLGLSSDRPYSVPHNRVDCLRQRGELSGPECTNLHSHSTEECLVPADGIRSESHARALEKLEKDLNNAPYSEVRPVGEIDGSSLVSFEAISHPLKDAPLRLSAASLFGNPDDVFDQRGFQSQRSRNKSTGTVKVEFYPTTSSRKAVIPSQRTSGSPGMIRRSRSASVPSLHSVPESLDEDDIVATPNSCGSTTNHVPRHSTRHATNTRNPRFRVSAAASPAGSSSNELQIVSRDRSMTGLSVSSSGTELRRNSTTVSNPELRLGASIKDSSPCRRTVNYPPTKIPEKIDRTWNPRQYINTSLCSQIRRVSSLQTFSEPCYNRAVAWVSTSCALNRQPTEDGVYHDGCRRENEPYTESLPQSSDENNNEPKSRLAHSKTDKSSRSNSGVTSVDDVAQSKLINVPKAHQSFPARLRASFSRGKTKEQDSNSKPSKHSSSVVGERRQNKPRDRDCPAGVTGLDGNEKVKSVNKGAPGLQNRCRTKSESARDVKSETASETASNIGTQTNTRNKQSVENQGRCPGKYFNRSDTGQLVTSEASSSSEPHVDRYSQSDCDDNSNLRTVKSRGLVRKVFDKFMPRRTEKTAKQEKSNAMKSQGKSAITMKRTDTKIGHSNSATTSTNLVDTESLVRTHSTTEVFETRPSDSQFQSMPSMGIPADEYFIALLPPDRCNHVHYLPFGGSNLELTMLEPVTTCGHPHQQLYGQNRSMSDIRTFPSAKSRSSQSMYGAQDPNLRGACSSCTDGTETADNWSPVKAASSDHAITMETDPLYNTLLKASIRLLHEDVVKAITPPSGVIDHLYSNYILTTGQVEDLTQTPNLTPTDRSRRLLAMLQESGNARCFVQLRMAMANEMATHWIVELVDKKCEDIVLRGVNASSSW